MKKEILRFGLFVAMIAVAMGIALWQKISLGEVCGLVAFGLIGRQLAEEVIA